MVAEYAEYGALPLLPTAAAINNPVAHRRRREFSLCPTHPPDVARVLTEDAYALGRVSVRL